MHLVQSPLQSSTAADQSGMPHVLAIELALAPSVAPSLPTTRMTTPSTTRTPRYFPYPPQRDTFTTSPPTCYICLSKAGPCDCTKFMPEDIRKRVFVRQAKSIKARRVEGYFQSGQSPRPTSTHESSKYATPRTTPDDASQVNILRTCRVP